MAEMNERQQQIAAENAAVLNKLCKWRAIFAGWQLGTRLDTDQGCRAVRDHREITMLLRVEVSALAGLLIEKGVFTAEEWTVQVTEEARALDAMYQERFAGIESTDHGIAITDPMKAQETMRDWPK